MPRLLSPSYTRIAAPQTLAPNTAEPSPAIVAALEYRRGQRPEPRLQCERSAASSVPPPPPRSSRAEKSRHRARATPAAAQLRVPRTVVPHLRPSTADQAARRAPPWLVSKSPAPPSAPRSPATPG